MQYGLSSTPKQFCGVVVVVAVVTVTVVSVAVVVVPVVEVSVVELAVTHESHKAGHLICIAFATPKSGDAHSPNCPVQESSSGSPLQSSEADTYVAEMQPRRKSISRRIIE